MDFEQAQRERDRRLRRWILTALNHAKCHGITGDLDGVTLRDVVDSGLAAGQKFEDEQHAIGLVRDLVSKQMVQEVKTGLRRGERFGLKHMRVRILDKGARLLNETLPVDPDIDDERVEA